MKRRFPLVSSSILGCLFSVYAVSAEPYGSPEAKAVPTSAEMEEYVRGAWLYLSTRIRTEDELAVTPARVINVPHTLCHPGYDGQFFECATLVVYELPNGHLRSSLVRHDVERDGKGRLQGAIVLRETKVPFK